MRGLRLGRILGVEVRIDYSWFVIFFLIVWTFSFFVFPAHHPGAGRSVHLGMGLAAALFFFASLLAHELSHCVVARSRGIPVDGITLFIFGGVARTRREPDTPGDEFAIAGIGPVTSMVLSVLLGAVAWLGARAGVAAVITDVAIYLAALNFMLAVFNLLPGFPLDGGRIFRSIAWRITGDITRATRWATIAGQGVGFLIIALGLWQTFFGRMVNGLWLVFIGWFIRTAAVRSWRFHLLHRLLAQLLAADAMTRAPQTLPAGLDLATAAEQFLSRRRRAFPIEREGWPAGILTQSQLRRVPREDWTARRVEDVMTPLADVVVVAPERPMEEVVRQMEAARATRALVLAADGRLVGIITASDILAWADRSREILT
jgi:Zn-dependent protease/CBS domain-containing protein